MFGPKCKNCGEKMYRGTLDCGKMEGGGGHAYALIWVCPKLKVSFFDKIDKQTAYYYCTSRGGQKITDADGKASKMPKCKNCGKEMYSGHIGTKIKGYGHAYARIWVCPNSEITVHDIHNAFFYCESKEKDVN